MHRLLLLGTGMIAKSHAEKFGKIENCLFVGCVDVVPGRAKAFAEEYDIEHFFDDLESALAWGGFDAAVNATPDAVHKESSLQLLYANKHVLCEKPLAQSFGDALEMTEAAEELGLINMVNFTYRNSAALQKARQIVDADEIGEIRHVEAAYRQSWLVSKDWGDWRTEPGWLWRLSKAHGSTGVLGDVGVHILDFASFGTGQNIVRLQSDLATFAKAEGDQIGDYTLDANDSFLMMAQFETGARGSVVATRYATGNRNELSLMMFGTKGALRVETDGDGSQLFSCLGEDIDTYKWREVSCPAVPTIAERFITALSEGKNGTPGFRRAAEIQRLIDAAFESDSINSAVTITS
ncbi:MAG: Gfo/Idh/MocA family oxidoreductase [Stappiaceae bacterium]